MQTVKDIPMSRWNDAQWEAWEMKREHQEYLDKEQYKMSDIEQEWSDEPEEYEWTDEDEAALEEWEEQRRIRIAEANEY
jgi:predicted P-loop ATPase